MRLTNIRSKSESIMSRTHIPLRRVETDQLLDEFIRCYCENQIPAIQVGGDETLIRIASPEFRYVEWEEVKA